MSKPKQGAGKARRSISQNRRARHDYEIVDTFEAGIELTGSEVKSLRAGQCTFNDSHAAIERGQAWLYNLYIAEYVFANQFNHDTVRRRRLLLHRHEIERLHGKLREQGLTLVPLELYFVGSWVKVSLGLAKGRKSHDKREAIKEREVKREIART
ncbi:MAG: SsrA-binding protein SmpB [Myxococcales bacterium]|nr:SsrA-binding protein SmpB [Myxococcales bacterium]MCB9531004.1 SsrA-binding protein SmpB [Myxococcales bacterium]MCB9532924.1 SsrA-binding protein SmpB [Myxococcales bacterium]